MTNIDPLRFLLDSFVEGRIVLLVKAQREGQDKQHIKCIVPTQVALFALLHQLQECLVQNFELIFFVCDHFCRKLHPGAMWKKIVLINMVFYPKLGLIEELQFYATRMFCAKFEGASFCL